MRDRDYAPALSPDGSILGFARARPEGISLVVRSLSGGDETTIQANEGHQITRFQFSACGNGVFFLADRDGDEQKSLFHTDLATRITETLWAEGPVRTLLVPHEEAPVIAVGRTDGGQDLWRRERQVGWEAFAKGDRTIKWLPDGARSGRCLRVDAFAGKVEWHVVDERGSVKITEFERNDALGSMPIAMRWPDVWFRDKHSGDTTALAVRDSQSRQERIIARHPQRDLAGVRFGPDGEPAYAEFGGADRLTVPLNAERNAEWATVIGRFGRAGTRILAVRENELLIAFEGAHGPAFATMGRHDTVIDEFPGLSDHAFGSEHLATVRTKDGLTVTSILTTPGHRPPTATVVLIHGGPWSRDESGFNETVDWYVQRGVAVLRINFRGSTGFGKAHLNAGDRQWGEGMLDDIELSIAAHARDGRVNTDQLVYVGHSFGGYAALKLATRTHRPLAVVALSPVVDLYSYVRWLDGGHGATPAARIGELPGDAARLKAASPSTNPNDYSFPTLIAWGERDARLPTGDVSAFAKRLAVRRSITAMTFFDEGHLFQKPGNLARINRWIEDTLQAAVPV